MKKIILSGLVQSVGLVIYILLVSLTLMNGESLFGADEGKSFIIPAAMLLLLTFSAAVCAIAVFGRSVMWYIDGKKKEAVYLLGATMGWLFLFLFTTAFVAVLLN